MQRLIHTHLGRWSLPIIALLVLASDIFAQDSVLIVESTDPDAVADLAEFHEVTIEDVADSIEACRVTSDDPAKLDAFRQDCENAEHVRYVDTPKDVVCEQTAWSSGPLSVPVINSLAVSNPAQALADSYAAGIGAQMIAFNQSGFLMLSSVPVAVIDTGVDTSHPGLLGRIDPASRSFLDNDPSIEDTGDGVGTDAACGHGTYIAGIIALMAPTANLLIFRAIDDEGIGTDYGIARAIVEAVKQGCVIINLSLSLTEASSPLSAAISYAHQNGVMILTSAGNAADTNIGAPTGLAGVWTIGGTKRTTVVGEYMPFVTYPDETIADFSNYGPVEFAHFATDVQSFLPGGEFGTWDGTSVSSAMAVATIVGMMSIDANLTISDIEVIMTNTALPIMHSHPLGADVLGAGRIDSVACLYHALLP